MFRLHAENLPGWPAGDVFFWWPRWIPNAKASLFQLLWRCFASKELIDAKRIPKDPPNGRGQEKPVWRRGVFGSSKKPLDWGGRIPRGYLTNYVRSRFLRKTRCIVFFAREETTPSEGQTNKLGWWMIMSSAKRYLDLPKGAKAFLKGVNSPSLRV